MNHLPAETLLETAVAAARRAGDHAVRHHQRRHETLKVTAHDVKLVLDVECQREAESVVQAAYPEHAILGEEGSTASSSPYEWVIDPIDGTVNFHHGLPTWCTSVAVRHQGEVVAGCIYVPRMGECYTATSGTLTARLNGEPIRVTKTTRLADALCVAGLGKASVGFTEPVARMTRLIHASRHTRVHGVAAIDLAWVAAGRVDAYLDGALFPWDYAAGGLLVEQAGGKVRYGDPYPDQSRPVFASNTPLHATVVDVYLGA